MDGMSCHKFGPIHQAVCPSHLNHFTLGWGSKLSTVSVLKHMLQSSEREIYTNLLYCNLFPCMLLRVISVSSSSGSSTACLPILPCSAQADRHESQLLWLRGRSVSLSLCNIFAIPTLLSHLPPTQATADSVYNAITKILYCCFIIASLNISSCTTSTAASTSQCSQLLVRFTSFCHESQCCTVQ